MTTKPRGLPLPAPDAHCFACRRPVGAARILASGRWEHAVDAAVPDAAAPRIALSAAAAAITQNAPPHAMHTQVPGHDGRPSFGGECLPKDTRALATCMRLLDTPHHVVTATIEEQAAMRDDRTMVAVPDDE